MITGGLLLAAGLSSLFVTVIRQERELERLRALTGPAEDTAPTG
jgi:hypothetical protein